MEKICSLQLQNLGVQCKRRPHHTINCGTCNLKSDSAHQQLFCSSDSRRSQKGLDRTSRSLQQQQHFLSHLFTSLRIQGGTHALKYV
ncbi:Hypothetical predicted protein [Cloeon dipterum]|uniref:Uncharacterized protein n=1 Tax=Cloeon dipterum TaxID=197152 RepID=A0A8S1C8E0_9INSE|nr:Hypothetical predicted protein [Cloeon dipterum]